MRRGLVASFAIALLTLGTAAPEAAAAQGRAVERSRSAIYDRGYEDGLRDGERDARQGRPFDDDRDRRLARQPAPFHDGYMDGYRTAYERHRRVVREGRRGPWGRGAARAGYQDPAFARGYAEGYERGLDDGRDRDRYDPVRHRDYRDGDDGYFRRYGSKTAYENNFRAGFRQGYEEGYREGRRRR